MSNEDSPELWWSPATREVVALDADDPDSGQYYGWTRYYGTVLGDELPDGVVRLAAAPSVDELAQEIDVAFDAGFESRMQGGGPASREDMAHDAAQRIVDRWWGQ